MQRTLISNGLSAKIAAHLEITSALVREGEDKRAGKREKALYTVGIVLPPDQAYQPAADTLRAPILSLSPETDRYLDHSQRPNEQTT